MVGRLTRGLKNEGTILLVGSDPYLLPLESGFINPSLNQTHQRQETGGVPVHIMSYPSSHVPFIVNISRMIHETQYVCKRAN